VRPADVLYFSSFTPDELRRGEISARHIASGGGPDPAWPSGAKPLHPIVVEAIDRLLAPGGVLIIQSYCSGIDVTCNPGYVQEWKELLARHDVWLVEAYHFSDAPGITLWIGVKGVVRNVALRFFWHAKLAVREPLTRFHGRSDLGGSIVKLKRIKLKRK
jgi:hypothetical protein